MVCRHQLWRTKSSPDKNSEPNRPVDGPNGSVVWRLSGRYGPEADVHGGFPNGCFRLVRDIGTLRKNADFEM